MIGDGSGRPSSRRCKPIVGALLIIGLSFSLSAQERVRSIFEALAQSKTVMYIGAHPDDENSIAAFLARSVGAGKKTYIVCFTRGENEPMDVGVPKGRPMAEARMRWLRDAAAILGAEPIQLPYTDGPSSVEELERGVIRYWRRTTSLREVIAHWRTADRDPYEDMIRLIREKKPDLLLTWEKTRGWTGNAEHRTVGWLAERAFLEAANPDVFPHHLRKGLSPWQPRWLYWVLRGDEDVSGHPIEVIGCEAPGPGGRTACEVKAAVLVSYRRHTLRTATPEELVEMERQAVTWVRAHPEHVQLALEHPAHRE